MWTIVAKDSLQFVERPLSRRLLRDHARLVWTKVKATKMDRPNAVISNTGKTIKTISHGTINYIPWNHEIWLFSHKDIDFESFESFVLTLLPRSINLFNRIKYEEFISKWIKYFLTSFGSHSIVLEIFMTSSIMLYHILYLYL